MASSWPVHTVVFDLDDTLFAEAEFVRSGFRAADAWLQTAKGLVGFAREAERLFATGRRGRIFDEALLALTQPREPQLIAQLVAEYRDHRPKLTLLEDAREIIDWAKSRFRLALISDGYHATQARKITALALEPVIGFRVLTDAWGRDFWKPHPKAFQHVMNELPGAPGGFIYVADNPRKDFIAPRALGWKTVRIRRAGGEHAGYLASPEEAADAEIGSLLELKHLLIPTPP